MLQERRNTILLCLQSFQVAVYEKPTFNITPKSKSYPPAKTVRLECQPLGFPEPEVYWLKNGVVLQMEERLKKQATGLVLSHSFTTDAGL